MLARLVYLLFNLYAMGLLIYVILSWVKDSNAQRIRMRLASWYEPFLRPIQRMLATTLLGRSPIDVSPIVLYILILIVRKIAIWLLISPF